MGVGGSREKDPAPSPWINITVHPPSHAILHRESPLYLPCEAIYTGPETTNDDSNYYDDEMDERSDGDDLTSEDGDFAKRDKMRNTHFADLKSDASMVASDGNELYKRDLLSAVDHQKSLIFYQWLRNDELIQSGNDTKIFANGTLRLTQSPTASGLYRCVANTTVPGGGAVLSTATHVQQAGKFASIESRGIFRFIFINAFSIRFHSFHSSRYTERFHSCCRTQCCAPLPIL